MRRVARRAGPRKPNMYSELKVDKYIRSQIRVDASRSHSMTGAGERWREMEEIEGKRKEK